jgi:hypothetical protein
MIMKKGKAKTATMKKAKPDITSVFKHLPQRTFTRSQIEAILSEYRDDWRLPESITVYQFIRFMLDETDLDVVKFEFPSRTIVRYPWGEVSIYDLVLSLRPDSYFSHYTAMYLNDLTEQVPRTIYSNFEQSPKPRSDATLEQSRIAAAFRRKPRVSNNRASYNDFDICLVNGKFTKKLGVIDIEGPEGELISVTNVERTLIDITVRPFYAGGVFEVLKAYKLAKGQVSVNKLAAMLKKIDYLYPYHQAIGFYLERSGVYKDSLLRLLEKLGTDYDFYLTYQMKDTDYSRRWRLHFPKGL